jgi:dolichol-phosphate mannosyltransferase
MNTGQKPVLSIITPTLREAFNIPFLAKEIFSVLDPIMQGKWELIVVDDNSQDGVAGVCSRLEYQGLPIRLLVRKNEKGLATAVIEGFKQAKADIFVVMDADLSHRPCDITKLYDAIIDGAEFALGSRYIPEGSTDDNWTAYRFVNSKVASLLAKPLVAVSDPMSGFFALPRSVFERNIGLSPVGYKIGLEIMIKCEPNPIQEIPIHFRCRKQGQSKLSLKQQLLYLYHLYALYNFIWTR